MKLFLRNITKLYLTLIILTLSSFSDALQEPYKASTSCCCHIPPDCSWAYNPTAYSNSRTGCEGFLDSLAMRCDFLWWRACEEGIALGDSENISGFTTSPGRILLRDRSRIKKLQFHNKPGFRLGFVHESACECWDLALDWTHFHSKATANGTKSNLQAGFGTVFISFWERGTDLFPLQTKSTWKLNIDLIDLELGRKYYLSSCLIVRPFLGLRSARITQTYFAKSKANSNSEVILGESNTFISSSKSHANLLAIGPRIGLEAEFKVHCGWSIFGEAATSVVFGCFNSHSREHYTQFFSENEQELFDFDYNTEHGLDRCSRTMTDFAIGLKWNGCVDFCRRMHAVAVAIAWEHHMFYSLNAFDFVSQGIAIRTGELTGACGRKQGDLSTQGLTVSTQVGF